MINYYYMICDVGLFIIAIIRRLLHSNKGFEGTSKHKKAILIGNGPSLQDNVAKIIESVGEADIYCVNYMALDDLLLKLKPRYYVFADPVFWRENVNSNIKKDNTALFSKLHLVDWKMDVLCPAEGASAIVNLIGCNKNLNIVSVPNFSINLKSERLTLLAYSLKFGSPIFINVLILALWHAILNKKQEVDIYGADFSSFKEYFVDQNTNELYSSYSHFYKNTEAQSNAGEKYIDITKKKIHVRLYQSWLSFQQMYLISLYARRLGIKIINHSSSSYLDCFDRH